MIKNDDKVVVFGSTGLVGSAIVRNLKARGHDPLKIMTPSRQAVDLTSDYETMHFYQSYDPKHVILAAARVGGIIDNDMHKVDFLLQNLRIQANAMEYLPKSVEGFLFLGSSCIYPRESRVPITEDQLLTGPLEKTNENYAIAKIAGIKLAQSLHQPNRKFISLMPTNLYGPNDAFMAFQPHVIPALIKKFYTAKKMGDSKVILLGDGTPLREFLYVDDMADLALKIYDKYDSPDIVNVGTGHSIPIAILADKIARAMDFKGDIVWSRDYNGTMDKTLSIEKMKSIVGDYQFTPLDVGIGKTVKWFNKMIANQQ